MKRILLGVLMLSMVAPALPGHAQQNLRQERLVYDAQPIPVSELPGVRLLRKGDSLLLAVQLLNDSIEPERRAEELKRTLANMLAAADADDAIELTVVDKEGYVSQVNAIDLNVDILGSASKRGMSHIDIRLKTAIPVEAVDGQPLVRRLRDFVGATRTVGRTVVTATGKVDISILNPEQYRGEIIRLITEEITLITGSLGDDYRVILEDLEKPLGWRRTGIVDLELYIPYRFRVIPGTVTSIN